MAKLTILSRLFLLILGAAATAVAFLAPPTRLFMNPELARILFFHLPCAFMSTGLLILAAYFSVRVLSSKDRMWDARANAAMELTSLFCILTMVTGMIFSKAQWGAWWQGDPRQTSFLLVLLIVQAYFVLRLTFADEEKRAMFSAAYSAGSLIPNLVLIFVLPRLPQVMSFHPSNTVVGGKLDGMHWSVVLLAFTAIALTTAWAYRLRVKAASLEIQLETIYGDLEDTRDPSAPTGVVRPLSVPDSGGSEG